MSDFCDNHCTWLDHHPDCDKAEQPAQQDSPWCMKMNGCKTKCEDCPDEAPKQPVQQEPCGWQFFQDGKWHNGMETNNHRANTEAAGVPVRDVYPSPQVREPLTDERKDAARWRFLVDNSFDKEGVKQFHVWEHSWETHSQTGEPTEWKQRVRGPALDRFIDRAIEAKLKEKNT